MKLEVSKLSVFIYISKQPPIHNLSFGIKSIKYNNSICNSNFNIRLSNHLDFTKTTILRSKKQLKTEEYRKIEKIGERHVTKMFDSCSSKLDGEILPHTLNLAKVTTEVDTARAFSRKAGNRSCTGTTAHKKFSAFFRPLLAFFSLYAVYKLFEK